MLNYTNSRFFRFKNAREIHPAGRIVQKDLDTGVYKLVFSEVWDTDEGEYTCELSNSLGAVKCSARLIIAGKFIYRN